MIADIQAIEKRTNPYAKQILISGTIGIVFILLVYFTPSLYAFQVPMAFLLPIYLVYGIGLATLIYQTVNTPLPIGPFLIGLLFVAGGAAFDGIATLVKSPTLTLEANPVARSLLDFGFSANLVIIYGIFSQIAFVAFVCILWAAFLKHKDTFLSLVKSKKEQSGLGFIKAAMGGAHLSWRQFFLPYSISEFPTSYYLVWLLPVLFVGGSLYRWYLGFNWLGLLSLSAVLVISVSIAIPFVGYIIWLWREYAKTNS